MAKKTERPGRIAQLRTVIKVVRQQDPRALPLVALAGVGAFVVFLIIGFATGNLPYFGALGVLVGIAVATFVFGRIAQKVQFRMLEGQPGGAAAILDGLRGNWSVTPAVAGNRNMDVIHRAVGRPGVILVGEGTSARVASLLAAEKKRTARVLYDIPIYDFQIGDAEGQVPIRKLQSRITRLPRNLRRPEIDEINNRLKALPQRSPMPRGPLPKNAKMPRMPKGLGPR
ncbi:MAG: DUF4191 domain-containing protein [Streptosporangiaceae bacterium]